MNGVKLNLNHVFKYTHILIACFLDPLQETIACFLYLFILAILNKSAISELKEGFNEIFSICMVFRKVISLIYENFYFSDRDPLTFSGWDTTS